jgi:hemerythrin
MARTWNAKLSVGVVLIDNQHRELFDRADLLAEALRDRRPASDLLRLVQYLEQWVAIHFDAEERLMQTHRHPGAEAHQEAHAEFCRQLSELKDRIRRSPDPRAEADSVDALFGGWMVDHVRSADAPVADLVHAHEPRPRRHF